MARVLVSIGIPFYNCAKTLAASIRSVFAQTESDWELFLIDDGSTDGSLKIALAVSDSRVQIISDGQNRGLVARLNQITSIARGKYIARMDADDIMHPNRIQEQVSYLEAHQEVDVIGTGTYAINTGNRVVGKRGIGHFDPSPASVLRNGLFIHPTVLGRRHWFLSNPYDPRFVRAEDRELWIRTSERSVFARLSAPLFYYREPDTINLRNYLISCRTDQLIFRTYGPYYVGIAETRRLIFRSRIKAFCYCVFAAVRLESHLLRRRNDSLCPVELKAAQTIINRLLPCTLSGFGTIDVS